LEGELLRDRTFRPVVTTKLFTQHTFKSCDWFSTTKWLESQQEVPYFSILRVKVRRRFNNTSKLVRWHIILSATGSTMASSA